MKKRDKVIMGTVVGGAIGSVLGLLFAPQTGKKTRNDIKEFKDKVYEEHGDTIQRVQKKGKSLAGKLFRLARHKISKHGSEE